MTARIADLRNKRTSGDELRHRLARARRHHEELASGRHRDASGVQRIDRQGGQPEAAPEPADEARVPTPTVPLASTLAPPRAGGRDLVRAFALVAAGAAVGVVAVSSTAPRSGHPMPAPPAHAITTPAPMFARLPSSGDGAPQAFTSIVTEPPGAELVLRSAVVANTPARVPRGIHEALYLIRRSGYHSQLVRVSSQSEDTITVTLRPLVEAAPVAVASEPGQRPKSKPALFTRMRGNDVGRQSATERGHRPAAGSGAR